MSVAIVLSRLRPRSPWPHMAPMKLALVLCGALAALGCDKDDQLPPGPAGAQGPQGAPGMAGKDGAQGPAGPAGKDSTADGSRLKARYLVADDGARTPTGTWHDTMLDQDCTFGQASDDGKVRCVPGEPNNGASFWSSDPTCAAPLTIFESYGTAPDGGACAPAPAYIKVLGSPQGCLPTAYTVYAIGAQIPSPPAMIYKGDGMGGCTAKATLPLNTYYDFAVVDPATLVAATIQ